jgi:hypothetical protein
VVEAWRASGQSVPTFARRAGLTSQRVYWWKERLRGAGLATSVAGVPFPPTFVPMTLRTEAATTLSTGVTVVLSADVRIEIGELDATSAACVVTLVKSLREVVR